MNNQEFIQHVTDFYQRNIEITKQKNNDYAGSGDVFRSFQMTKMLNNTTVEEGFVVRMGDKLSRISTLIKQDALVENESLNDTLADLANYCAIMSAYIHANNRKTNTTDQARSVGDAEGQS